MQRIKIDLPERFVFSTELKVRVRDVNYGGHLGHDALLSLLQDARIGFLKSLGCKDERSVFGLGLIMVDVGVVYLSEGFQGDDLKIEIGFGDSGRCHFELYYKVQNLTRGKELAQAKTGMAFYDYNKKALAPMPAEFKAINRT